MAIERESNSNRFSLAFSSSSCSCSCRAILITDEWRTRSRFRKYPPTTLTTLTTTPSPSTSARPTAHRSNGKQRRSVCWNIRRNYGRHAFDFFVLAFCLHFPTGFLLFISSLFSLFLWRLMGDFWLTINECIQHIRNYVFGISYCNSWWLNEFKIEITSCRQSSYCDYRHWLRCYYHLLFWWLWWPTVVISSSSSLPTDLDL